jgi:DNA-binding transcriptional LysR family regulator
MHLLGDRVDCVIRGGALNDPSLIARRLGSLKFVTCATPEYLAIHGTPSHPTDLETNHQRVRYFSPELIGACNCTFVGLVGCAAGVNRHELYGVDRA